MNGESLSEETLTTRMSAVVGGSEAADSLAGSLEEGTQRMDTRAAPVPDQDLVVTRAVSQPPRAPAGTLAAPHGGTLGTLEPGEILCGDCVVVCTHQNHESARPGLFECNAPEGRVMVKVAAADFPPQPELWGKLADLKHPHVLRIFRTHEAEGRFYEVQEFCTGGTLTEYVPVDGTGRPVPPADWIEQVLVKSFRVGISYLHHQGIVHRDIKPSNLYLREDQDRKTLVIGDFDISSMLQTGRTSRSTQRAAGTWIYSAPEAFPRFLDAGASKVGSAVVRASDYYSFGVVLVELLLGTTPLHQAQLPDLYDFYLQGGRVQVPAGLSPRLTELLGGLLCRNRHKRWGSDEVARWLAGRTTEEDRQRIEEDQGFQLRRNVAPFNAFDSIKPTSLSELGEAMAAEPQTAQDELMSGDVMLNWIGHLDARIARRIRSDREKWQDQPRIALLCARLHIDPDAGLSTDPERRIRSSEDWAEWAAMMVLDGKRTAQALCGADALLELQVWLELKAAPEPEAAARVREIAATAAAAATPAAPPAPASAPGGAGLAAPPPFVSPAAANLIAHLILEELFWAFLPSRPFQLARGIEARTPREIALLALGDVAAWGQTPPARYLSALKRWEQGFLEAYLRQRLTSGTAHDSPLLQQMQQVRQEFGDHPFAAFEIILRLLDPELPPVELEFNAKGFENLIAVGYGEETTVALPFRTRGAGMPYAAVQLQTPWAGLQLQDHEIVHRRGEIKVRLYSQGDIPVGREHRAMLSIVGNTTRLAGGQAAIRYKVVYPFMDTVRKMAVGGALGALILGGARALIMTVAPSALHPTTAASLGRGTWAIIVGVLLAAFYVAFRLWLWAFARLAR